MLDILTLSGAPGGAIAVRDAESGGEWSYSHLRDEVERCASRLAVDKGMVLLLVGRDPRSLVNYLGALKAGHAVLPVERDLDRGMLGDLVRSYRPEFILGTVRSLADASYADLPGYAPESPPDDQADLLRRTGGPSLPLHPDLSLLLSTSGSTGSPKLVRLSPQNVLANANAIRKALAIEAFERPITSLPWSYSFGLSVVHSHLLAGGMLVLTERSLVSREFWDQARESRISSFYGVPYMYDVLRRLDFEQLDLPSLGTLAQAGGKLGKEVVRYFADAMTRRGGRFFVMYGQTEATARMSVLPWEALPDKLGSVGLPLPGGTVHIQALDEDGDESPGHEGEVIYTGPNVMMGYAEGRADLARGDELGGTLRTGDLGFVDSDGYLYITGRLKRIAKVFGHRVSLDEVEGHLHGIGSVAALEIEDRLCVCCLPEAVQSVKGAVDQLSRRMHVHSSGFTVKPVPTIPLLSSGKIDYTRLRALLQNDAG